jgi:hypothetical protein
MREKLSFILILGFFLLVPTIVSAQNLSVETKIKPAFTSYFALPRASLYLHLNKSSYLPKESIWFSGYFFNRVKSRPFDKPLNLNINIYDDQGNQVKSSLFLSDGGYVNGHILVDSLLSPGQYFIKASTGWMRNFKEDDSYIQGFEVLAPNSAQEVSENFIDDALDIQIQPEGGHILSDVQNVLGIKVLRSSGMGAANLRGWVQDSQGRSLADFTLNQFGMAKVNFEPGRDELYSLIIKRGKGNLEKKVIPRAELLGINLSVRRLPNNKVLILAGMNQDSKRAIGNLPYSILIHRDGLLKRLEVQFPEEELYVSHLLDEEELHSGINIFTLVDNQGKPIAERLYFNAKKLQRVKLTANVVELSQDSVSVDIMKLSSQKDKMRVSVSVLPAATIAHAATENILSTFLLKPYVKGFIESPAYYFSDLSSIPLAELDLLLLNQGWSKYDWDTIFTDPPVKKYDYKTGVDLLGHINEPLPKNYSLKFYSSLTSKPVDLRLQGGENTFRLNNYFLEKGDRPLFVLENKDGKVQRPSLYVRTDGGFFQDKINIGPYKPRKLRSKGSRVFNLNDFIMPPNIIALDEVIVEDKMRNTLDMTPMFLKDKLQEVTEYMERIYPQVLDLIRSNGFKVWVVPNAPGDRVRITTSRVMTFSMVQPSPILYIDDVRYADFDLLLDLPMTKVERYYIDRSGLMEAGGAGGVIRIYTRQRGDIGARRRQDVVDPAFFVHTVEYGFEPEKRYYMPKYASTLNGAFERFGAIHWEPKISLEKKKRSEFKFLNTGQKSITLFIEGMGESGSLVSEVISLEIEENP